MPWSEETNASGSWSDQSGGSGSWVDYLTLFENGVNQFLGNWDDTLTWNDLAHWNDGTNWTEVA